ncbi:MAG: 3'-5' exonuclease, partial [Bacteroidales bacterium]
HDTMHAFLSGMSSGVPDAEPLWEKVNRWFAAAGINRKMADYLAMPLYEFGEQVIRDFYGDEVSGPAVQYLLDLTASFIQTSGNDLGGFVQFLDEKLPGSIPLPETGHAVRIMTIHKAKGLQFPVVIYAFAMETTYHRGNRSKMLWVEEATPGKFEGLPVLLLPFRSELENTPYAGVYKRERDALLQDVANVVYVALTRPAQQLYIVSAPTSRKTKSEFYLYDILQEFLPQCAFMQTEDQVVYRYGSSANTLKPGEQKAASGNLRMPPWKSYSWQGRLGIRSGQLVLPDDSPRQQAITRGTLFHNILAAIGDASEIEIALDQFVNQGLVPEDEREVWFGELSALLNMTSVRPFFNRSASYRSEATIITPDGKQLRPDRVVMLDDHIGVLDFKTGFPKPSHQKQVNTYCDLLRAMGHMKVKGYLLYVDSKVLEEI